MLEQFKVKPEDAVRVREENLRETVEAIFEKMGLDSKDSVLGAEPFLGTNPIAVAAPARKEAPFVSDAAMIAVAGNKFGPARRNETKLLGGWGADS